MEVDARIGQLLLIFACINNLLGCIPDHAVGVANQ